jgi:hypothetical protein
MASCRVGKGGGTALVREDPIVRRAHQGTLRLVPIPLVGTAYDTLPRMERQRHRLCPPYEPERVV